ncbi:MAG: hypothetical protein KC464_02985, partial [Myxococcales bacterium]|nr:hypothetical protein [Myxococcales bacterium]
AACGHGANRGRHDDDAVLRFDSAVAEAGLWVDGRYIGPVGALAGGVALTPGPHRFEVRDDDHFSWYAELTVAAGERRTIAVELAPRLP